MKIFIYLLDKKQKKTFFYLDTFLVRKSVKIGFHVLPSRKQLDDVIFHGRKAELSDEYQKFIRTIKQIYDICEACYAEKKYLQLP
jgi:hypothetical protein